MGREAGCDEIVYLCSASENISNGATNVAAGQRKLASASNAGSVVGELPSRNKPTRGRMLVNAKTRFQCATSKPHAGGAMLVETFSRTLAKTGLRVGVENVQRFFPESITEIDLRLGHLQIVCKLDPEFWRSQPEIFDERLSAWLESKHLHVKPKETPTRLAMVPIGTGTNVFRLRLLSPNERKIEQSETRSKERRT